MCSRLQGLCQRWVAGHAAHTRKPHAVHSARVPSSVVATLLLAGNSFLNCLPCFAMQRVNGRLAMWAFAAIALGEFSNHTPALEQFSEGWVAAILFSMTITSGM